VKKEELSLDAVKQYKVRVPDELEKIEVIKNYIFEIQMKLIEESPKDEKKFIF